MYDFILRAGVLAATVALIYGGRGRHSVSRCGYGGKKRVLGLHSIWVVLPVYVTAFMLFLFVFYPFIHELSHAGSYEDGVKSHQLSSGRGLVVVGCSAGIPHFLLLLLAEGGKKRNESKALCAEAWLRKQE